MSKQDLLKTQTCILRVNIDCDGCKSKVKKTVQKIDDVYATAIDMQQGKVTVTGNVDPDVLIRKLEKSGKRAELWSSDKGNNSNKNNEIESVNDQLKKLPQVGNGKGGGDDVKKSQQKGGKDQQKSGISVGGGKNLQQINFQQLLEQMKSGSKDFNMKDQKKPAIKVDNLPGKGDGHDFEDFSSGDELDEEEDYDDDEFDEEDDEFDEDDDEFDEDDDDDDDDDDDNDDELDNGGDQHRKQQKTFMPIMTNDLGKDKKGGADGGEKAKKGGGGGGGDDKKNGGIMSMIEKVIGGNNEGKDGSLGKKGGGEGGGKSQSGGGKNGGNGKKSGGGGPKNGGEGKNGNVGGGGFQGGGDGMGQMGQYLVGPMGHQFPATPMMNMNGGGVGYYAGVGPVPGNPYQQQQYMAMMMNGGGGGGGMYHPAMYGRPPPGYGYVPPPVYHDHITHMFSDENPGSCSIM